MIDLLIKLFSLITGGSLAWKALFGKTPTAAGTEDANTQAVAIENKLGAQSADVSRNAQMEIDYADQDSGQIATDRHAQLAAANGLRARAEALNASRDSADTATRSNGELR